GSGWLDHLPRYAAFQITPSPKFPHSSRFVSSKSEEQQARAAIFRARERVVRQRTELMNALRGLLYEYGAVFPVGLSQTKRIQAHIDSADTELPALVVAECQDLLLQISEQTARIETKTKLLARVAASSETARRLQTMPGVGPMTALAVEVFAPDITEFRCGRDFSAWLGLVPRQYSSGGNPIFSGAARLKVNSVVSCKIRIGPSFA
ncbi:transposase, partial [Pseudorhodobacter sp. W20_MBD10_FR17]|uniref:transposase n=1 Tax=Pseudorhodobacter sp. W20_MBD10_FR17 TaxID=3240266 RepID=UPI003F996409